MFRYCFSVLLLIFSFQQCFSQHWEHLTPIKNTDRLTTSIVVNDQTAYMAGAFGVLLKTVNGGESWSQEDDGIAASLGSAWTVGIHFPNDSIGYLCDTNGRIWKIDPSLDFWTEVYDDQNTAFSDIHFIDSTTGFLSGYDGQIYKTAIAGLSWEPIVSTSGGALNDLHFITGQKIIAVGDDGMVLLSNDGGETWETGTTNSEEELFETAWQDEMIGVAVGRNGTILTTNDGGNTWISIPTNTDKNLLAVAYLNESIFLAAGTDGRIFRSNNSGQSFEDISFSTLADFRSIVVFSAQHLYILGEDFVIESFDAGLNWQLRFEGVAKSKLNRMQFTDANTIHVVGGAEVTGNAYSTIIKSTDGGRTWNTTYASLNHQFSISDLSFVDADNGYASGSGTFINTSDGGESNWDFLNNPGPWTAIHMFDVNNGLAGRVDGIFETSDGAKTWDLIHTCDAVNAFFFLPNNQTGFAALQDGGITRTFDGGATWTTLDANIFTTKDFQSIAFANDTFGIAIGDGIGRRTLDGGETWEFANSAGFGRDLHFPDPNFPMQVYAVNAQGELLFSDNGALNWTEVVVPSISNMTPVDMVFAEENWVYICGRDGDIFRAQLDCIPSSSIQQFTSCGMYIAPDGDTLLQSGEYRYVLEAEGGCDSMIIIQLNLVDEVYFESDTTACDFFQFNDQLLTSSGTYFDTIKIDANCDSVLQLNLELLNIDTIIQMDLNFNGQYVLSAVSGQGDYQWLDCEDNFTAIANENTSSFLAEESGQYALEINNGVCRDTSNCIDVLISNIEDLSNDIHLEVFPNPVKDGKITVRKNLLVTNAKVSIINTQGIALQHWEMSGETRVLELDLLSGLYFLKVDSDRQSELIPIVILE